MGRPESRYVCQACGASALRWEGRCPRCGEWDALIEVAGGDRARTTTRTGPRADGPRPVALSALADESLTRHPTGIAEFDRVLGGGLVPGSLVLVGGEPGIGKSTLALEAAAGVARRGGSDSPVLYASGEESPGQVRLRAARLGATDGAVAERIHVLAATEVGQVIDRAASGRPALLVVDSVQTLTSDDLDGPAGSVGQVREVASRILAYAKDTATPVVLVGHVTKEGQLAGPKTLEHLVDVVLTLEGERFAGLRLLRATKNRFGSTEELGVFEMTEGGLREVVDPARAFLGEPLPGASGVAIAPTLEGTRPLLVEVQALVAPGTVANPRRTVAGIDPSRLALLVAVLGRRAGIALGSHDIYASVVGGLSVSEPALDLPLALALASSARDRAILPRTVATGEVGLLGELRPVTGLERRLREAERLGFADAIVPAGRDDHVVRRVGGLEVHAARTLRDAIELALEPRAVPATSRRAVLGSPTP